MSGSLVEGIGQCAWWGLSPAQDLAKECLEKEGPLRVLCVGAADIRHIIKTVSMVTRGGKYGNQGNKKWILL